MHQIKKILFGLLILGQLMTVSVHANEILFFLYQDPFGNVEMQQGQPAANPEFKYTDKEYEEDLDAFYFQARYYDPVAGRFWGRDQVKIEDKTIDFFHANQYTFNNNNPVKFTDPNGKDAILYVDRNSVALAGHMGLMFQDSSGQWWKSDLTAKNPLDVFDGPGNYEVVKIDQEFVDNFLITKGEDALYIETNHAQDIEISKFIKKKEDLFKAGKENYQLLTNNCKDNSIKALQAGGLDIKNSSNPIPNINFDRIGQEMGMRSK